MYITYRHPYNKEESEIKSKAKALEGCIQLIRERGYKFVKKIDSQYIEADFEKDGFLYRYVFFITCKEEVFIEVSGKKEKHEICSVCCVTKISIIGETPKRDTITRKKRKMQVE